MRQLIAFVLAGCAPPPSPPPPTATPTTTASDAPAAEASAPVTGATSLTLACETSIESVAELPATYTKVLDVVALPTGRLLQAVDHGGTLFSKSGLVVRAGASFTIEVNAGSPLRIGWGKGDPAERIVVTGCTGSGEWLAFAGGFWAEEPGCYELVVRVGKHETVVQIGIGATC